VRIGDLIAELTRLAGELPDGEDAQVLFGSCDGHGLHLAEEAEVTTLTRTSPSGAPRPPAGLLRVHTHDEGAVYLPGVAESLI